MRNELAFITEIVCSVKELLGKTSHRLRHIATRRIL